MGGIGMEKNAQEIKNFVKIRYGGLAQERNQSCCAPQEGTAPSCCAPSFSSCCGPNSSCCSPNLTEDLYTLEELENIPGDIADFSLGCGNPTAIAELVEGEVVLDLGSGGGLDCFLAARKVGDNGRVIGLDMTPEMIRLARQNAEKIGAGNIEFRLGEMEHMPVEGNSIDVIISNCVINLSPDKDAVFKEAYRVLKPGGRLCVSDMVLLSELPAGIRESLEQWSGCIAGALEKTVYLDKIRSAGFVKVEAEHNKTPLYIERGTFPEQAASEGQSYVNLADKVASVRVKAFKN